MRSHVFFFVSSDQVAATESYGAAFGIAVVSEQASAIGITAIPTPVTDAGSSLFFAHGQLAGRLARLDATGITELGVSRTFDFKSMRKVEVGADVVVTVENSASELAGAITIVGMRLLIKTN